MARYPSCSGLRVPSKRVPPVGKCRTDTPCSVGRLGPSPTVRLVNHTVDTEIQWAIEVAPSSCDNAPQSQTTLQTPERFADNLRPDVAAVAHPSLYTTSCGRWCEVDSHFEEFRRVCRNSRKPETGESTRYGHGPASTACPRVEHGFARNRRVSPSGVTRQTHAGASGYAALTHTRPSTIRQKTRLDPTLRPPAERAPLLRPCRQLWFQKQFAFRNGTPLRGGESNLTPNVRLNRRSTYNPGTGVIRRFRSDRAQVRLTSSMNEDRRTARDA